MINKCQTRTTFHSYNPNFQNVFEEKTAYLNEDRSLEESFYETILKYINREPKDYVVLHNLKAKTNDIEAIVAEFLENHQRFHTKKKKYSVIEHFKISLSPKNRPAIIKDPSILIDIATRWLQTYAPECLGYVKLHFDKPHPHAHILISGNLLGSPKQNRKTKKEFKELQWQLELYKREKYPFLEPLDFYQKDYRPLERRKSMAEQEMEQRFSQEEKAPKKSEKEQICSVVRSCLGLTNGEQSFKKVLAKYGFRLYLRGKTPGIQRVSDKRKFRLKTLGLLEVYQETHYRWKRIKERRGILEDLRKEKTYSMGRELSDNDISFMSIV